MSRLTKNINQKEISFAAVVVFIIGALISVPTLMVGFEQEGSWLIAQIGAILFCLTAIIAFMLVIISTSKKAEWDAALGLQPPVQKFLSRYLLSLYMLTFSLALVAVVLTVFIH